jgi:CAAX prenyl protease-like protein
MRFSSPFVRYLAPFGLFLLLGYTAALLPTELYWAGYAARALLVLLAIVFLFKNHAKEIAGQFDWKAVGVGLAVLVIWVVNYHLFRPTNSDAAPFDTHAVLLKLLASSLVVPLVEELFFRSFLMRYFIKNDFLSVPLGSYTAAAFWMTALAFAAMHPSWQWGAALLASIAYGGYLIKTQNLVGCIFAHGVTNAGIGLYVIATGSWGLWI